MNVDTLAELDITLLLIVGFIKKHCTSLHLLTFTEIIDLIQSFYVYDEAVINNATTEPTPPPQPMDIIDETAHALKLRNSIEPSILLIYGYIREEFPSTSLVIYDLIYSFYTKMNGTSFVWKIDNTSKLLSKLLSNNHRETVHFDSNVFEVTTQIRDENTKTFICSYCNNTGCCSYCHRINHLSLKYYVALYPNGIDVDTRGEFELQLNLVSIPSILQSINFIYSIYCHELHQCWFASSKHDNIDSDGKITKCESVQILTNELPRLQSLTFYICLDIIRIKLQNRKRKENKIRYNPMYFLDENEYMDTYDNAVLSKFMMINDEWKLKWNINEDIIHSFKTSNMRHRLFVSDIYYNIWCLTLHHKKIERDKDNDNDNDIGTVGLRLCALPSNISSIVVQIKLKCLQSSCSWSAVKKFHELNKVYKGQEIMMKDLTKVCITAHIEVIEAFDLNGKEMSLMRVQQRGYDAMTTTSIGYTFVPRIEGGFNMRYYYQHISMAKDGVYSDISNEEVHKKDRDRNPNRFNPNRFNDEKVESTSDLQRIGTLGWNFKPFEEDNNIKYKTMKGRKKIKTFYYQHICIEKPFMYKQSEELRFEDLGKKCASKQSSYNMLGNTDGTKEGCDSKVNENKLMEMSKMNENIENLVAKITQIFDNMHNNNDKKQGKDVQNDAGNDTDDDDEFKEWYCREIGYNEYYEKFVENGWNDMDVLDALTNDDLIKMKIKKQGHRVKIVRKIKQLYSHKIDIKPDTKMRYDFILKIMTFIVIFTLFCNTILLFKQ